MCLPGGRRLQDQEKRNEDGFPTLPTWGNSPHHLLPPHTLPRSRVHGLSWEEAEHHKDFCPEPLETTPPPSQANHLETKPTGKKS